MQEDEATGDADMNPGEQLEPWETLECGPCEDAQDSPEARKLKHVIDPMRPTRREVD